jgi:molybdopterin-containing oxidoreductase family iron-sulfur binding subunit/tetrathionate reductase subunit B
MKLGFVIDLRRCIGCDTCVVSCKMENAVPLGAFRLTVLDSTLHAEFRRPEGSYPALSQYWVPTMCHHCGAAPCIRGCPTRALWRDAATGAVTLDKDRCIGCRRCEEECPYDALWFADESGTADKCDQCRHRHPEGNGPMCELVCPTRAIRFGDLDDPTSKVAQLVATREHQVLGEETGAGPSIRYLSP